MKRKHLLPPEKREVPLHTYIFAIHTYKRVSTTTLSVWPPERSSQEHTKEVALFVDTIQAESEEEAIKEGMEHYRHHVLPHLRNRPEPLGAWRQHLSKYENNFYPRAMRIHDYQIREGSAAMMIRNWTKCAQTGLLENQLPSTR